MPTKRKKTSTDKGKVKLKKMTLKDLDAKDRAKAVKGGTIGHKCWSD